MPLGPEALQAVWLTLQLATLTTLVLLLIATLLWLLDGQERITLASRSFSIRREAFALGLTRHYDLREVSNLRVVDGGRVLSTVSTNSPPVKSSPGRDSRIAACSGNTCSP